MSARWPLAFLAGMAVVVGFLSAQIPPDKVMATFKVSPGLDLQLWASEPMMTNPTCMDIDHKGRIWLVESVNYRYTIRNKNKMRDPQGDRIVILEDSKGSGKADKRTVFYQSPTTLAPLSIAVLPHTDDVGVTVYIAQSPDILVFEDKDGDGKADGPPRKLLSGFKGYDHDHGVHGLFIGPDNKLYFTVGDEGVNGLPGKNGRKWTSNTTDCRAGTCWRCDLDGKNLELLAHNFRNHYEMCMDSFGTLMVSDNDDDGSDQTRICYVMPGGNYGYNPRGKGQTHWHEEQPGVVPKVLRTFRGSPTGMCFYEGSLLPEKYRGQPLHVDAGPGRLSCYHMTTVGAAYALDWDNMVTSSDKWFRPSDVCVAPDGSVYITDWYDPGVGGHNMRDTASGRVYRIAPKGHLANVPAIDLASGRGVLDALASPNLAVRHMAMAKLGAMDRPQAVEILVPAAVQKANEVLRARALWQLARIGNLKYLVSALSDPDPRFRVLAMRALSDFHDFTPDKYTDDLRQALLSDSSPAVRREALLLLREVDPVKAKPLIVELARQWDGKDRFYLCAVGIAVGQNAARRQALLGDFERQFPKWDANMVGLLWELRPPAVTAMLLKKVGDPEIPPAQRARIVDVVAGYADAGVPAELVKVLAAEKSPLVRDRILEIVQTHVSGKWSSLRKSADLKKAAAQLLADPKTTVAALDLVAAAGFDELTPAAGQLAQDARSPLPARIAAARALGQLNNGSAALLGLLEKDRNAPAQLRVEAAQALGKKLDDKGVMVLLQGMATDKAAPLPLRQTAVASLSGAEAGCGWLLEAFGKKALAADLVPDLSRLLRGSPFPLVKKMAAEAFPPPPPLDPKNLPSIPALLARPGSVQRGKKLMTASLKSDAQCLKCHTIQGIGGQVGPDLSSIGLKASRENLLESILYPSRAIADQYQQYQIETKRGLVINGILIEDAKDFVLLRDANAKDYKIAIGEIDAKRKIPTSLMPDLLQHLPEQDLVDIVDYLATLKSPPVTPGMPASTAKGP